MVLLKQTSKWFIVPPVRGTMNHMVGYVNHGVSLNQMLMHYFPNLSQSTPSSKILGCRPNYVYFLFAFWNVDSQCTNGPHKGLK